MNKLKTCAGAVLAVALTIDVGVAHRAEGQAPGSVPKGQAAVGEAHPVTEKQPPKEAKNAPKKNADEQQRRDRDAEANQALKRKADEQQRRDRDAEANQALKRKADEQQRLNRDAETLRKADKARKTKTDEEQLREAWKLVEGRPTASMWLACSVP